MTNRSGNSSLTLTSTHQTMTMAVSCFVAGVAVHMAWLSYQQQRRHKKNETLCDLLDQHSLQLAEIDNHSSKQRCIYLDTNGTTPIYPTVLTSMMPYLTQEFGNPSSIHAYGQGPKQAIQRARQQVYYHLLLEKAKIPTTHHENDDDDDDEKLQLSSSSIWFTACGTESDNLAIHLALQATAHRFDKTSNLLPHIITSNIEHPAVSACLQTLQTQGRCTYSTVLVQDDGTIRLQDLQDEIQKHIKTCILVTIMYANNEIGTLQTNMADMVHYCHDHDILFHTDAAQAAGKTSIALSKVGPVDFMSIVGHKFGAPKGIACLYVRPSCCETNGRQLSKNGQSVGGILLQGGGQEFGMRSGTENVPYIVGMGTAAALAYDKLCCLQMEPYMESLRNRLLQRLQDGLGKDNLWVHGPKDPSKRLPNTLSIGIRDIHSGNVLRALAPQVAASAGATCHTPGASAGGDADPMAGISSVLRAIHAPVEFARGTLRFSVGTNTTQDEIDQAAAIVIDQVQRTWKEGPSPCLSTLNTTKPQSKAKSGKANKGLWSIFFVSCLLACCTPVNASDAFISVRHERSPALFDVSPIDSTRLFASGGEKHGLIPPPPSISMPVWSLAAPMHPSRVATESTSMNIVTFAIPVSVSVPKQWIVSLYYNTLTKDSFRRAGWGVLQLLRPLQKHTVPILGKHSGYDTDGTYNKRDECTKIGALWVDASDWIQSHKMTTITTHSNGGFCLDVLANCACYVLLRVANIKKEEHGEQDNDTGVSAMDAGDHEVVLCEVIATGVWDKDRNQVVNQSGDPSTGLDSDVVLYTGQLRKEGII